MDFEPEEIRYLLDLAKDLKSNARTGIRSQMLKGKTSVFYLKRRRPGLGVPLKLPAARKAEM
jgi:orni_carb_tr: ornithine carbamoyltransferase